MSNDPLFVEYARTAPLLDLRWYLAGVSSRIPDFGLNTCSIVREMRTLEETLSAIIERGDKVKGAPKSPSAQKRLVWTLIDRYRASIPMWPRTIDGYYSWPEIDDTSDQTSEPERPPKPELLTSAASELLFWAAVRALGKCPANQTTWPIIGTAIAFDDAVKGNGSRVDTRTTEAA